MFIGKLSMPLLALALTLFAMASRASIAAEEETASTEDKRLAWRHTEKMVVMTIFPIGEKLWTAHRTDGKKPNYTEIERTKDHIILQNVDTKLFIRLETNWAYWRRPRDAKWTRWTKGEWVNEVPEGDPLVIYNVPGEDPPKAKKKKKKGKSKPGANADE